MWFKKTEKPSYEYNTDVPFEVAFKALKEGCIIKYSNYNDIYLRLLNGRIYQLMDRQDNNCFEIDEFSVFDMMIDKWQVLPPNSIITHKEQEQ